MITMKTALDIWSTYKEIDVAKELLATLEEAKANHEPPDLRDGFGRQRGLQLGIPSGESSTRCYDVAPNLAIAVLKAHVAAKEAELTMHNERAKTEAAS